MKSSINHSTSYVALLGALVLGSTLGSAHAFADSAITGTAIVGAQVVRYDDLDTATEADRKALVKRIKTSVARACAAATNAGPTRKSYRQCKRDTQNKALAQLDTTGSSQPHAIAVSTPKGERVVRIDPVVTHSTSATTASTRNQRGSGSLNHKGVFVPAR